MGIFDDMLAAPQAAPAQPAGKSGIFDDMLQQPQQEAAPQPAMSGTTPVPTTLETFFQNLPKYPGVLAQRFGDMAKALTSGEALPQSANMPGGEKQGDIGQVLNAALMGTPLSVGGTPKVLAPFKAPTEAALDASKTARYNDPAILNLQLQPHAGPDVANIIRTDLKAAKLDKFNAKPYYDIADRLENGPRFGDNFTIADFDMARQDIDAIASPANRTAADRRAAPVVRNAIDNYLGNIPQSHVLSGDATAANDALLKARSDTAALKRSQDISDALQRAQNRNPAAHSGGNLDNLTRQQLRPILDVKTGVSKVPGFEDYTPQEIDALRNAIDPGWLQNQARNLGKKLGSGGGAGHSLAGFMTGTLAHDMGVDPMTSVLIGLGSMGAGKTLGSIAGRMANARGDYLGNLLRSRSALADEMRANPQMVPAFWPQLLRAGVMPGAPSVPTLGINAQTL